MPTGTMKFVSGRGFGFIKPDDGGDDLFVHVRSFVDGPDSLVEGDRVAFDIGMGRNGRPCAEKARLDGQARPESRQSRRRGILGGSDQRGPS